MDTRALGACAPRGLLALVLSVFFLFLAACGDEGNDNAGNGTDGGNNTATTRKMLRAQLPPGFDAEWFVNGRPACATVSSSCKVDLSEFLSGDEMKGKISLDLYCEESAYRTYEFEPNNLPHEVSWSLQNGDVAPSLSGAWLSKSPGDQRQRLVYLNNETQNVLDPNTDTFYLSAFGLKFISYTEAISEDERTHLVWYPEQTMFEIFQDDQLRTTYILQR